MRQKIPFTNLWLMTLRRGEVILVRIAFHQTVGGKVRPATVLLDPGDDDFVAAPITSRSRGSAFEVPIQDWRQAGLNVPSTIRVHKLTVLPKEHVVRRLGELSERDRAALNFVVQSAFTD